MATTLATLRTRARQIADMVDSQFIPDAELDNYINTAYFELYDLVVSSFEDYFTTSTNLTITTGNTASLPADFYKARAVDYSLNGNWATVKLFNFLNRNSLNRAAFLNTTPDSGRRYRIMGNTLIIQNVDNAAGTYRLWYAPAPNLLTDGADSISTDLSKMGWDEYIPLYAAERMLSKEESSTSDVLRRRGEIAGRITQMAADRQMEQSDQISDSGQNTIFTGGYEY